MTITDTDTLPTTVGEVLTAAADLVERYGLHKGDYWPGAHRDTAWDGQPVCAGGAIRVVDNTPGIDPLLCTKAQDTFADWLITGGHTNRCTYGDVDLTDAAETIAAWSDHPARTAQQVAAALRACAADNPEPGASSSTRRPRLAIEAPTGGDE
jgi:hypothetical protein